MAAASTGADFGVLCGTTNSEAHTLLRADLTPLCPGRIMDGFSSMRGPPGPAFYSGEDPSLLLPVHLSTAGEQSFIYI